MADQAPTPFLGSARAGVWTFFAVVHLWSVSLGSLGPLERLTWLAAVLTP